MSMSLGESGSSGSTAISVGGGVNLPGVGGAGGTTDSSTGGAVTPPYLMGSYAYLCGGDKATCVPGKGFCSTIEPTENDGGFGGSFSGSGTSGSAGTGTGGVGGSDAGTGGGGVGGSGAGTGGGGVGGSGAGGTSTVGTSTGSGVGGSPGTGGSSPGTGGSGVGGSGAGGSTTGAGGTSGSSGSSTGSGDTGGSGSDGGAPVPLTCKLSSVNGEASTTCTVPGDLVSGNPCQTVADCGVGLACVATASGGLCRPYCCGQVEECPTDTYCAPTAMAESAVKIPVCLPAYKCKVLDETTCPTGQTCTIVRDDGTTSCVEVGEGVRGDACPCAPGHVCSKFTNTCLKLCHIGNDAADCGAGSCQGGVMAYPDGIGICAGYPLMK
ncbi:MAG: hypothetical protein ACMG6S_26185 [Byssovorax sp.]